MVSFLGTGLMRKSPKRHNSWVGPLRLPHFLPPNYCKTSYKTISWEQQRNLLILLACRLLLCTFRVVNTCLSKKQMLGPVSGFQPFSKWLSSFPLSLLTQPPNVGWRQPPEYKENGISQSQKQPHGAHGAHGTYTPSFLVVEITFPGIEIAPRSWRRKFHRSVWQERYLATEIAMSYLMATNQCYATNRLHVVIYTCIYTYIFKIRIHI